MAERLNRTLLGAVRAALHMPEMSNRYWPLPFQDVVYKYNLKRHSRTSKGAMNEWLGQEHTDQSTCSYLDELVLCTYIHRRNQKYRPGLNGYATFIQYTESALRSWIVTEYFESFSFLIFAHITKAIARPHTPQQNSITTQI